MAFNLWDRVVVNGHRGVVVDVDSSKECALVLYDGSNAPGWRMLSDLTPDPGEFVPIPLGDVPTGLKDLEDSIKSRTGGGGGRCC
jgi:hypothetical protein